MLTWWDGGSYKGVIGSGAAVCGGRGFRFSGLSRVVMDPGLFGRVDDCSPRFGLWPCCFDDLLC
ncbi:hypothetical protein MPC4_10388 [Methylocella tundrae]|uniref:Uncharacterized protein n=1 Tax=Methylocella tundrae TaxID=227605 RepID=A0A8B6M0T8_METTU|nr:hypothetical protein MPC1_420003 [Methylocella tundrae]VTZ48438.1 hypothetical protein MPC4_10388 [Methylocella tundrae]